MAQARTASRAYAGAARSGYPARFVRYRKAGDRCRSDAAPTEHGEPFQGHARQPGTLPKALPAQEQFVCARRRSGSPADPEAPPPARSGKLTSMPRSLLSAGDAAASRQHLYRLRHRRHFPPAPDTPTSPRVCSWRYPTQRLSFEYNTRKREKVWLWEILSPWQPDLEALFVRSELRRQEYLTTSPLRNTPILERIARFCEAERLSAQFGGGHGVKRQNSR